jgi:TolB-like protein/Tfp pilus assembly protein PilF
MSARFFAELKRRNVYKVAVAYAVVGWVVVQVSSTVLPTFHAPEWVLQTVVVLVILGFPVALIIAWAFEATPGGIKRTEVADVTQQHSRSRVWIYVVIGGLALSLALFYLGRFSAARAPRSTAAVENKSIAVLPFENLSEEKANAFFASGIQDEILTALAKISGLKVISRKSTARFESSPQNIPEIARQLGVANILEGSVQKIGDKVHINLQLIRADTDSHIWAKSYDRLLADIFAVEGEVARSVADELRTTLSPEEKTRVERKPTENADAYVLFLRANEYSERPSDLLEDEQKAAELYEQAIALDPGFASAHARLSAVLAHIYLDFQPTDAIAKRARAEAEEALRLQPDLGEGHHARAMCLYWIDKNFEPALRELEVAATFLPNNADITADMAYIRRRQGRWVDALSGMSRALDRDPRNAPVAHEIFRTYCDLRDWANAATAAARASAMAPDSPVITIETKSLSFWSKEDIKPLRDALAAMPAGVDPDGVVTLAQCDAALIARDFAAAEQAVASSSSTGVLSALGVPIPKEYLLGLIAMARGEAERARQFFEQVRPKLESESAAVPADSFRHAQLGLLYAYLGRKDDALREGRRAVELTPESRDHLIGPPFAGMLALICARVGEADQAIALIEHLLSVPAEAGSFGANFEANLTLADLRHRWQWDPLRNDPRFQKILAAPEPKTVYQ